VQTVVYLIERGFPPLVAASAIRFRGDAVGVRHRRHGRDRRPLRPRRTVSVTFAGSISGVLILFLMNVVPEHSLLVAYVLVFGCARARAAPSFRP